MSNSHSGIRMAYTHPGNPAGPTITLRVKAGDEINLEVYAKYDDTATPQVVDGSLAEALTNSVNDAVVGVEGGALTGAVSTNIAGLIAAATPAEGKPKAYLQYVLFDESFTKVGDGYIPVDKGIDENGWKYLLRSDEVKFDGYLYAYVVNESNLDVFFDDFTVQVLGTRAIRKTDYYPFGALAKQWNNPDQTQQEKYRHGYQGQYAEMDTTTGWNSFELRMYDPIIGRWMAVDPYRQFASPYKAMGNNPVYTIDPDGGLCQTPDGFTMPCPEGFEQYSKFGNDIVVWDAVTITPEETKGGFDWSTAFLQGLSNIGKEVQQFDINYNLTGRGGVLESSGRVIVGATPMSVYDGGLVLGTEENMYGEDADSGVDKGFAVLGILGPANLGSQFLRKPALMIMGETISQGVVIDRTVDVLGAVHDSGTLDSLKE